jgi:hypothetical protein
MESLLHLLIHTIEHTLEHTISMLPFLFAAFLVMETLEHYSGNLIERSLIRTSKAGPLVGAFLGCFPQCGFSVIASNLYAGGVITLGTLLAVFLSTSDEAVLILLSHPESTKSILPLLAVKVMIAIIAGYLANFLLSKYIVSEKHIEEICEESCCGCNEEIGILRPAITHTLQLFAFIFLFTAGLDFIIDLVGLETVATVLLEGSIMQPLFAALIGFIPNCVPSVILTELYLKGTLSFASIIAGLCTNAGMGLIVLFKVNRDLLENLKIMGLLYISAVIAGMTLNFLCL